MIAKRRATNSLSSKNYSQSITSQQQRQGRDSGYTEAHSDLDSHQLSHPTRVGYPFSDDDNELNKKHQSTWSTTLSKTFQSTSSLTSTVAPSSIWASSLVYSSSYHIHQADTAIDLVRQYTHETNWKKVLKHKSGVVVYMLEKQVNGDKLASFKGELVISSFTPQAVFYVIGMRKLWDTQFEDGHLVQNLNETTSIIYEAYKSNGSSRAHDLTLVEKIHCSNDGVIIFACTSVDTNQVAKVSGRSRNQIKLHGWILRLLPTTPPSTHVTFITEEYLRGWIPGFTKKSLARKPLVIASIDKYLKSKTTNTANTQQPLKNPLNKFLGPLSECTRRRPSIMTLQPSASPPSFVNSYKSILKNPPPRHSSLKSPQTTTSRSSSLAKRITFADNITTPSSIAEKTEPTTNTTTDTNQAPSSSSTTTSDKSYSSEARSKLYPLARHRSSRKESNINYKRLLSSDLTEWKQIGKRDGVMIYTKIPQGDNDDLPIMRGEGWLAGSWTVEQLCSVVQCFGSRSKWDDYFENGKIIERFSQKEYLVHTRMKSIFPINGRDFSLLTHIDTDTASETIHVISTSVSDKLISATDDYTRGRMLIYGWTFQALKDDMGKPTGVNITFISHLDLAGTTPSPSAIVRLLSTQMPLYVLRVQQYITTNGHPPYIKRVAGKVLTEVYDPDVHVYKLTYIAKHSPSKRYQHHQLFTEDSWCTDIRIYAGIYNNSLKVTTRPQQDILVIVRPDKTAIQIYTKNITLDGTTIELDLTPSTLHTANTSSTIETPIRETTQNGSPPPTTASIRDTINTQTNINNNQLTTSPSIHPLVLENNKNSNKDTCMDASEYHNQDRIISSVPHSSTETIPLRKNSIIIIGDQLSFNGPQLSLTLLLVVFSYYVGKLSCQC